VIDVIWGDKAVVCLLWRHHREHAKRLIRGWSGTARGLVGAARQLRWQLQHGKSITVLPKGDFRQVCISEAPNTSRFKLIDGDEEREAEIYFADGLVHLSWIAAWTDKNEAVIGSARLDLDAITLTTQRRGGNRRDKSITDLVLTDIGRGRHVMRPTLACDQVQARKCVVAWQFLPRRE
jgi:hypothetical protein